MDMIMIVNGIILVYLVASLYSGYKEGFLMKLLSIASFFVIGILSWWLSSYIGKFLALYPHNANLMGGGVLEEVLYDQLNRIMIFVILFVLLNIAVLILKPIARILGHLPVVSTFNKVGGCILGLVQAVLILILITMVLRLPFWKEGNRIAESSLLRYSDPIAEAAIFYCREPLQELQKITQSMEREDPLNEEEISAIHEWLLKQNIEKGVADEFVSTLRN